MKHISVLAGICILIIIRPAAGWSESLRSVDEFGIVLKTATFYIGLPEKEGAMAYLRIPEGTLVKILEEEGAYYRINHKDLIGYVEQKLVKKVPPMEEGEPVAQVVKTPAPVEKPIVKPGTMPPSKPSGGAGVYQVTEKTSLRQSPDSQSEVLLRLPIGGKVEVLEKTDQYWWKARYDGRTGWVKCALLRKE